MAATNTDDRLMRLFFEAKRDLLILKDAVLERESKREQGEQRSEASTSRVPPHVKPWYEHGQ